MNHNPSDDSANVPPSGQAVVVGAAPVREDRSDNFYQLNPSLQQALNCLDIKLEDELNRFRSKQEDSPELQPQIASTTSWHEPEIVTADLVEPMISQTVSAPKTSGFVIIDGLSTSSTNSRNASNLNYAPISLYRGNGSQLSENLNLNYSLGGEIAPFHDEYLSSSQELLQQIRSGYPNAASANDNRPQSESTPKRKNLNPLKLGSVAAACLLAGGAVYAYLNPSLLAPLTATKVATTTTTTSSLGQLIQSPNLAANEFTELNLSTLNTIKLPTATTTNVSMATTSTMSTTQTGGSTTPVAIPFNVTGSPVISPSSVITPQPRLADSLIKSLLPPNFQTSARRSNRTTPLGVRR